MVLALDGKEVGVLGSSMVNASLVNPAKSADRGACMLRAPKRKGKDTEMTEDPRPGGWRWRGWPAGFDSGFSARLGL